MISPVPKSHRQTLPAKKLVVAALLFSFTGLVSFGTASPTGFSPEDSSLDSVKSVAAFKEVYKVLMSPRCMNCHPSGNVPLQGEDSHLHTMLPKRGEDGKGIYAMKCSNCHQSENVPGVHTPPGNPKWHLPPADMKMVFQGKTPRQLALQLMDKERNGHKDKALLLEHARDTLVKAGWNPGAGRALPPLTYEAFVNAWDTWINTGGFAPAQ